MFSIGSLKVGNVWLEVKTFWKYYGIRTYCLHSHFPKMFWNDGSLRAVQILDSVVKAKHIHILHSIQNTLSYIHHTKIISDVQHATEITLCEYLFFFFHFSFLQKTM